VFIRIDSDWIAAPLGYGYGNDFIPEPARRDRICRSLLATKRKLILIFPAYLEFLGYIFGGL
jgi:hypothetical protein